MAGDADANPAIVAPTGSKLQITYTKLYVPVVTLSAKDDNNFLEQLKSGFKRTIKWNKCRSAMTNQTKTLKSFNQSIIYKGQQIICFIVRK